MTELTEGIRRHGFRKWYERELLRSHAHLAALIICTLGLMMALEASMLFHSVADQLTDLVAVVVFASAALWTLRRYLYLLVRAESIAHQADCPHCKAYGRLELVHAKQHANDRVRVRCRACSHEWDIHA